MAAKLNLQLTKQQQQIAVVAALLLVGGGFSYIKYFWLPISAHIAEVKTQKDALEDKITKAKGEAARLPKIQQELVLLNQQATEAEKRLPKSKDVPEVIDTLSRLARQSRVDLMTISPNRESAKQYFIEIPYALSISGAYHDIGRFFAAIALEDRIYNVRDVVFSGPPDAAGRINATFTFVAYQYKG